MPRNQNSKLLEMLRPWFDDSVTKLEELIYPVYAKAPTEEDKKFAGQFRREVTRISREVRVKIPLPCFVLEQYPATACSRETQKGLN